MEKWARTGHLITRHRGATDFHRGLGAEAMSSSSPGTAPSHLSVGRAKPDLSLHHLVSSAGPLSGLAATMATVTLSSGFSFPPAPPPSHCRFRAR